MLTAIAGALASVCLGLAMCRIAAEALAALVHGVVRVLRFTADAVRALEELYEAKRSLDACRSSRKERTPSSR
jgi:hypothetical protein